jgi:hypothetical protein
MLSASWPTSAVHFSGCFRRLFVCLHPEDVGGWKATRDISAFSRPLMVTKSGPRMNIPLWYLLTHRTFWTVKHQILLSIIPLKQNTYFNCQLTFPP